MFWAGVFESGHIDVFGGLLEGGFPGVPEVLGLGGVRRCGGDFHLLGLGPGGDGDVEGFLWGGSLVGGAQQVDGADGVGSGERCERCGHGLSPSAALDVASALLGALPWAAIAGGAGGRGCRCRLRLGICPARAEFVERVPLVLAAVVLVGDGAVVSVLEAGDHCQELFAGGVGAGALGGDDDVVVVFDQPVEVG